MLPVYDKYAPFIWSAYAVSAVVLIALLLWSLRSAARVRKELEARDAERLRQRGRAA